MAGNSPWRKTALLQCASLALLLPQIAHADDATSTDNSTWVVTLGANAEYGPSYPGSNHRDFSYMPSFDYRRLGDAEEYSPPDDGVGVDLISFGNFSVGPVIGFRDSRSPSDDKRLDGLRRIHWDVDAGISATFWIEPNRLRLHGELRHAISNGSGLIADLGVDYFQPLTEQLVVSAGLRASLANDTYMQSYFGINATDAARNGTLSKFDADAGLKSVGLVVSASFAITPEWTLEVYDRFDRLTGDASKSPITSDLGSRNQNIIGISLTKAFNITF